MTYQAALDYLASLQRFGIQLGLQRIEQLLALLGNPHLKYKVIHIAGTNGKGSTSSMLTAVLVAAGIRTGTYISPHLDDYTERFCLNGEAVGRSDFAAAIAAAAAGAEQMVANGLEQPTEFEVLTAAAYWCFAEAGVEYMVVEVGLGGRFDSTNVVQPEVCVITNVSLDHVDRLGSDVAAISWHKAGIIKTGRPLVTAATGEALAVIRAEAELLAAPVFCAGEDFHCRQLQAAIERQTIEFVTASTTAQYQLSLLGRHQVENAGVVLMVLTLLQRAEPRLTSAAIADGLSRAVWPGRFEVIGHAPLRIVDGAHNVAGAVALRTALDDFYPDRPVVFVLGMLADKDVASVATCLVRDCDFVLAVSPDSPRALAAAAMADLFKPGQAIVADTLAIGIEYAVSRAGMDGIVCVAGSLYQAGAARALLAAALPVDGLGNAD